MCWCCYLGGDPDNLHCAYCPSRYGYLFYCHRGSAGNGAHLTFAHLTCYLFNNGSAVKTFCPLVLNPPGVEVLYEGAQPVFAEWETHFTLPFAKTVVLNKASALRSIPTRANVTERVAQGTEKVDGGAELEGRSSVPRMFSDDYTVLDFQHCRVVVTAEYKECLFSTFRNSQLIEAENQLIATHHLTQEYKRIFPIRRGDHVQSEPRGCWSVC